jgi:CheY-like chemotaxis protein
VTLMKRHRPAAMVRDLDMPRLGVIAKRALTLGAFDYVTKPIDFDYLTQAACRSVN